MRVRGQEGLTLSTEEVSDLRNSLHHDCHTPDEDSDDDMSVAGTKRTFDDLSSNASSGRGRPDGEGASDSDGGGPLLRKKVKNVTPTYRPQAEEHGEPRTRISLEFSAVDTQDMDPRVFSLSKPMPAPRAGLGPVSFDVPV
mmetsp:Transcript_29284/g.74214  ORF Transcript_29284/g.74214 Transcript_29284/m.74214 type:complete len:141 (-) Transcript_29284:211-633(-)